MTQEIEMVLEPQEKIVWQDVINRKVLVFNFIISFLIIATISFFLFSHGDINYISNGVSKTLSGSIAGLVLLILGLVIIIFGFLSSYVVTYVITNKRLLIKSGLIGTDFNSIYFTEVRSVNVNVNLIDKIFSVGTLNIDTGKIETVNVNTVSIGSNNGIQNQTRTQTAYDKIVHISNPYEVYKYFQTSLTGRQESLYSGRADNETLTGNPTNISQSV